MTVLELHQLLGAAVPEEGVDPDPWYGVVSTDRIRRELGYRPYYPTVWSARDAGAL